MKRFACIFLVLISYLFLIQSCEEESTNPPNDNLEIIPLKVGNYWKAIYTEYNTQGSVIEIDTVLSFIDKDTILNKEKVYRLNQSQNNPPDEYNIPFLLNRQDGCYILLLVDETILNLYLKYPAKKGDVYSFIYNTVSVEEININHTVKAGSFKCYKYKSELVGEFGDIIQRAFLYYSPGIGQLSTENYDVDDNNDLYLESKWELIEYKVK